MAETGTDRRVEAVRRFNRFYTQRIGVLREGLLQSPFSLTEVRVMYELAHREGPTASELRKELGLDAGYLSRILRDLGKRGLINKRPSKSDGRQTHLRLTKKGQKEFATLNSRSDEEVAAMLGKLPVGEQQRLVEAMHVVEETLGATPEDKTPYLLRPHQPGDMGWIVHRHGVLYSQEYGWDEQFEAFAAEIVAQFVKTFDPKRERCWIAEKDGEIVGCVFLVQKSKTIAKLRLLLVEPRARGLGIGKRLVTECIRFGRQAGYKRITLWTNSVLHSARHIYEEAGFQLIDEAKHHSFGQDLVGQTWELKL
jgi:DNA-binding MarR family transcriptional regulator/N-acetylglutamate synthase-like GNAT family acetyltransferase